MGDYDLLFLSIGSLLGVGSLCFCCHYLQLRSQLQMYQNLFFTSQETTHYTVLPSAPPVEA